MGFSIPAAEYHAITHSFLLQPRHQQPVEVTAKQAWLHENEGLFHPCDGEVGARLDKLGERGLGFLDFTGGGKESGEVAIGPGHPDLLAHGPARPLHRLARLAEGEVGQAQADIRVEAERVERAQMKRALEA